MECYETCADRGRRCVLPREKISCGECGKIKPCYNIYNLPSDPCSPKEPGGAPKQQKKETWRSNDVCRCKQTCWEWILSFLGFGGKLPECCRNVRLTAWQSGEVAREALVSKVQEVISYVSGREASSAPSRFMKTYDKAETKEADKKLASSGAAGEKEGRPSETSEDSPELVSGKEQAQASPEKKRKKSRGRSSSLPRGRTKHRKQTSSKSRSTSRSDKQQVKESSSKTRSGSSSSTSVSTGERKRKRSRSKSGSGTKIFNPFKGRTVSSPCNMRSPYCPPLPCTPCPSSQPKSFLSCLNEDQMAIFPEKCTSPTHQQSTRCRPTQTPQLRRSNSMSYKGHEECTKLTTRTCQCHSGGDPQLPTRSHSFDSTPMRFTSPHVCCLSAHTTCPRSSTWACCSRSMKSDSTLRPYVRGSGIGSLSQSTCLRPVCCLPLPGGLTAQQYTNTRPYVSPTSSIARPSCFATLNVLKTRQNDAVCNQLLSKYGYSSPGPRLCPLTSLGCTTCCSASSQMYGRLPGMGGCIACRPMADTGLCVVDCVHSENCTNSRKPRSPECQALANHIIEFNHSPCEKKPLCEFQLPPHCIRETGPRSPVDEYMAIIRVPKHTRKPDQQQQEFLGETAPDLGAAHGKESTAEVKPMKKKLRKLSRKGAGKTSQTRNVNENARSEGPSWHNANVLEFYETSPGHPNSQPHLACPTDTPNCCLVSPEESCNNNYGGESYRISRYSSAGPVQIDFSELNVRANRFPNMPTQSSASSGYLTRYSKPNYHTSASSSSQVGAISSLVSQKYSRDTREILEPRRFGNPWYTPTVLSHSRVSSHKLPENFLSFNRSTNSTGLEGSEMHTTSKYHVNLETAIENKIRELRSSRVFGSPPARKKMYSNSLFEQMTRPRKPTNIHIKRNILQEEFIRDSLDQLNYLAQKRKNERKYSTPFANLVEADQTAVGGHTPRLEDACCQHPVDCHNSCQNSTSGLHSNMATQSVSKSPRGNAAPDSAQARHIPNARNSSPGKLEQSVDDLMNEYTQLEASVCSETGQECDKEPPSTLKYEPVFQSLFQQFEETVKVYVRSKKEAAAVPDSTGQAPETAVNMFSVFGENKAAETRNSVAPAADWIEANHSCNKADKTLANVRTLVAESSPPHKPLMVKSSDADTSSVSTCSCGSNSRDTSSVSLQVGRLPHFTQSSHTGSESVSCVETSLTFTKVTDVQRPREETPVDYPSHVVNPSMPITMSVSTTWTSGQQGEEPLAYTKTMPKQLAAAAEPVQAVSAVMHVLEPGADSGSSVDPIRVALLGTMVDDSSVDAIQHGYYHVDVRKSHMDILGQPEAGDASSEVDPARGPGPPVLVKSLTPLMREFIRCNGTPV